MYTMADVMYSRDSKHPYHYLYQLHYNILVKIDDSHDPGYEFYGARGITYHEDWRYNKYKFMVWILNNLGPRPENMTLDRIDNDGHYEPGNLRWASRLDQVLNQRPRQCTTNTGERCISSRLTRRNKMTFVVRINGEYIGCKNSMSEAIILRDSYAQS